MTWKLFTDRIVCILFCLVLKHLQKLRFLYALLIIVADKKVDLELYQMALMHAQ